MSQHLNNQAQNKSTKKIKQELESDYNLSMYHKEIFTTFYDYYMEFTPENVKRIFKLMFSLNKMFRLLLIYCLFYHSIWWLPNSTTKNMAINYSNIDPYIFLIIIYFNFYQLIINNFLLRKLCSHIFKPLLNLELSKLILSFGEVLLYISINFIIFCYFYYYLNFSIKYIIFIMVPHSFFLVYNMFDIRITLFNYNIFSNQTGLPIECSLSPDLINNLCDTESSTEGIELENNINSKSPTVNTFTYTDCSNISIASYLNSGLNIQNLPHNLTNTTNTNNASKIIKNRYKSAKIKSFNSFTAIIRYIIISPYILILNLLRRSLGMIRVIIIALLTFSETSELMIQKRDSISSIHDMNNTSYIPHRCQKDPSNIRAEATYLKNEFNNRLKSSFIQTFESIYFTFFIGRICVPTNVNIRDREYFVYLITATISTFISYWLYYMPLSFLISLNRNSEHLGSWKLINETELYSKWLNYKFYYIGDQVSYMGKSYKVKSKYCSAQPSCKFHEKFYRVFSNPFYVVSMLLFFKSACFIGVILLAYINRRWYTIVINIMEVLLNSHTFFILCRDFFILYYTQNFRHLKLN